MRKRRSPQQIDIGISAHDSSLVIEDSSWSQLILPTIAPACEQQIPIPSRPFVLAYQSQANPDLRAPGLLQEWIETLKHGIVYSKLGSSSHPHPLPKEPKLGFPPLAVKMCVDEKLAKESRVNYAKLVTIEHNFEVLFIGQIGDKDFKIVKKAVDECWTAKTQHKPGRKY
jgi:hypothetical protein